MAQTPAAVKDNYPLYFIDIETVPQLYLPDESETPYEIFNVYGKRFKREIAIIQERDNDEPGKAWLTHYRDNAALYAEYGKIVSISIGKVVMKDDQPQLRIKNIISRDEVALLTEFNEMVRVANFFCAHNGKEFDFPFINRRQVITGAPKHWAFDPLVREGVGCKKPWEMNLEDTIDMWGGVQWKYKTSLEALCVALGLPSPKTGISGKDVATLFYMKGDLPWEETDAMKEIADYNNGDVVALANVWMRLKGYKIVFTAENTNYAQ